MRVLKVPLYATDYIIVSLYKTFYERRYTDFYTPVRYVR